ncbi:hypothetical protein THRCLA_20608 [Thraustotheca clavata]|uniref:Uncharacterized protein n=1 Tax=Thraustotheca clavata TaxID=74557 RepID=A0A1W0A5C6_9STRA|nr:hypothetical protein THRCLA_20608 [Thraustotheca clavata]
MIISVLCLIHSIPQVAYPHDKTGVNLAYLRMFMYQKLTSLEGAILGLRKLQPIRVTTMIAQ